MRSLTQLCLLGIFTVLFGAVPASAQTGAPRTEAAQAPDTYWLWWMKRFVQERKMGAHTSHQDRYLPRLGDKAAIALVKIYDGPGLIDPKNVEAYLPLIPIAFSNLQWVTEQEDHNPAVTKFLLNYLRANVQDAALKDQISKVEAQVLKSVPKPPPTQ